MKKNP